MKHTEIKKAIVDAGIRRQESIIEDFRERIKDILSNDGNVNEEEYDNHQQSFKAENISEANLLSEELQFANKELEELRKMEGFDRDDHQCVEYGSVVKTDKRTFFVSASLEEFAAAGLNLFGLSVHTPLYKSMKGKTKGEIFSHAGISYKIEEIF